MSSPTITTQPQSQIVNSGSSVTFTVVATSSTDLDYQWYFNCEPINGATDSSLTISSVSNANTGLYYVILTNSSGSTQSSNAFLTVNNVPIITGQPQSKSVGLYSSVSFEVTSYSLTPMTFQWYFNSTPIPNATNNLYFISSIKASDAGIYYVIVTNSAGSTQSSNATLIVNGNAPVIIKEPKSQDIKKKCPVKICVKVREDILSNPTYQWYRNDILIPNATFCFYEIKHFKKEDEGKYYVIVSNENGSTQSKKAKLKLKD